MLFKLLQEAVDAVFLPLSGTVLPPNGREPIEEAAVINDASIGFLKSGAKINNFGRFDVHHPQIKRARRTEKICIYAVIRHLKEDIQNRISIYLAVPDAADNFGVRSDLGELFDKFAICHRFFASN